ncbi:MAG: hypothetical protein HOV81_27865 [Kofleriaceae bacterium]|nr:hypothetical protein [Kofleriaceae bacterium]
MAIAGIGACSETVDDPQVTSEATSCMLVGTTWWNQGFSPQTGTFHVEFSATPSAPNIDAVIGISDGAASTWSKLAAIVRFNPEGFIDARAGGEYRADSSYRYDANTTYYFRVDIDVRARTYSVRVGFQPGEFTSSIAQNYPFRTEQASVTRLSNIAGFVNRPETSGGSVQLCGINIDASSTGAGDCFASNAGGGFANVGVAPSPGGLAITFTAKPSSANIDGVVGVAGKTVTAYNDMAASIRFFTNGLIEARDGDVYRADVALPYTAGDTYDVTFVLDVPTKTYSVYVYNYARGWYSAVKVATGYHFRPQQETVARIDHVATVVASTTGRVDVCRAVNRSPSALHYLREGSFHVVPFVGDSALIADGTRTYRVSADGATTATYGAGGHVAVDRDGNIYLAREASGGLVVESYTSSFSPRWTRLAEASGGVIGIATTVTGEVLVAVPSQIVRFGTDGSARTWPGIAAGNMIAVGAMGYAGYVGGNRIESHYSDGTLAWSWAFNGSADITAIAVGPDGSLVFGGEYYGTINFGDRDLYPSNGSEGAYNAFMVVLSAQGRLQFSTRLGGRWVNALAFNGSRSVAAVYDYMQFPYNTMYVYDWSGTMLRNWSEEGFGLGDHGNAGEVAISASGRVWANLDAMPYWTSLEPTSWPYLVSIATQ